MKPGLFRTKWTACKTDVSVLLRRCPCGDVRLYHTGFHPFGKNVNAKPIIDRDFVSLNVHPYYCFQIARLEWIIRRKWIKTFQQILKNCQKPVRNKNKKDKLSFDSRIFSCIVEPVLLGSSIISTPLLTVHRSQRDQIHTNLITIIRTSL